MPAYKDKNGRWRYRFAYKGKRYGGSTPKGGNTKKIAEELERHHLERLMSRRFTGTMPTVAAFVTQFLDHQKPRVKPLTFSLQKTILDRHVVPLLGKRTLDDIGPRELDQVVTEWSKKAAPRTINTRLGTLMRMLGVALEWDILHAVPKVTFLKIQHDTPRFLSEPEAVALLEAAQGCNAAGEWRGDWHSMVLIGLRTGLRVGELRGLQWGDIDLARGALYVQRTDPGIRGMEATSTKGNRGRIVPLARDALTVLRLMLDEQKDRLGEKWSPSRLVWPAPEKWRHERDREHARSESNCVGAMQRMTARAKLKDVGWHTLRHTFASWLVMRGVPLRAVQELLGHASIKMTERYSHLAPGFAHQAAIASLDLPLVGAPALPSGEESEDDE